MHNTVPVGAVLQHRYRIMRLLGQGGMGAVYLAHDQRLDKACALKETLDVSPQAQRQFKREARFLARLQHPHLPRVTDYFAQTGRYYLVMDYVAGQDLEAWVQAHGPAPLPQVLAWTDQVLSALDYLHRQSPPVIHRDVKPVNIRVTPDGRAVLVDFGIAKEYRPGQYTLTGARAFSPGYAPLEQYAARGQTDARTDLYALGATLYFLLTGMAPVDAPERAAGERLPSLREANPHRRIPPAVEEAVMKALALQKQERWPSADKMRQALRQAASSATAQPPPPQPRSRPPRPALGAGGLLWGLGIMAAVLMVVLGLLALLVMQQSGPRGRVTPTGAIETAAALFQPTTTPTPPAVPPAASPAPAETATLAATPPTAAPGQPTATPVPTHTPAPRPTSTKTPRGPAPANTPSPTPRPTYPAPRLATPENGATGLNGVVHFAWEWDGPTLEPNDYFDLRIWAEADEEPGGKGRRGVIAPTKQTTAQVNLDQVQTIQEHSGGTYYWGVVVVHRDCPACTPKIVGAWSVERHFTYAPPPGPEPKPEPTEGPGPQPTKPMTTPLPLL